MDRERLEAIWHCKQPWDLSEEEYGIWEEHWLDFFFECAGYY